MGTFKANSKMFDLLGEVLTEGRLSYGSKSKELESRFAKLHVSDFAVLSNSGTSSLQVALQTLKELHGWNDDDEVIIPAVTFVATANIVLHNRMIPIPVDIDPDYYELDPAGIEPALSSRTRAIIPVHLFGQPCDMLQIRMAAREYNLKIIEDSCEAMFVSYKDMPVGSWGDIGCFSTYVAHLLTTGVGGIGVTSNPEYAVKMRSLVNHGRDGIYFRDGVDKAELISKRFNFESIGHSYRITELEAALALAQLDDWDKMLTARNNNAAKLSYKLEDLQEHLQLPQKRRDAEHAWMMYPIVLLDPTDKWHLLNFLEERGVETREMLPLINQPCYAGRWHDDDFPIATWINRFGFYIGCHQDLVEEDLDYIAEVFHDYFKEQNNEQQAAEASLPISSTA